VLAARQRFDPTDEGCVHFWDTVQMREVSDKIVMGLQIFLGLVGGMTLLVAGVGLANMLFVLVYRRTREIGMQMAIGAKPMVVTARTVGESLILAGIGGYVGIALAWLIVEGVQRLPIKNEAMQFLGKPTLSLPLGLVTVLVLVGIGCFAGALPARRASRLNPVEALRHE
jgi:putative ABC transport system permease protein